MLDIDRITPGERRRAETRTEIIEQAWSLARDEGLGGLSLRSLAARVGMRAPSLYSYFDSKDAIYDAMFADGYRELVRTAPPLPGPDATRADFVAGARHFVEFCIGDPVRYQLLFQRSIPGFVPSVASYAIAVDFLERFAGALARLGVTDRRHLDLWTAIVSGIVSQQLANEPDTDRWTRLLDEAAAMFCDHVGILPT